jgi:hypothetical protein
VPEVDFAKPFIVIRREREGTIYERTMDEFLVNPLEHELLDVVVSTSGWVGTDDGVVTSDESKSDSTTVPPKSFIVVGSSTPDEYDEFVVNWNLRYRDPEGNIVTAHFHSWKELSDTKYIEDIPVLGGPGLVVPNS